MAEKPSHERGISRDRRAVYLRMPIVLYQKLCRLVAEKTAKGQPSSVTSVVCELISEAPEERAP